jgi:alkaline phosphatase D
MRHGLTRSAAGACAYRAQLFRVHHAASAPDCDDTFLEYSLGMGAISTDPMKPAPATAPAEKSAGPLVGHVDDRSAVLWYRAARPGRCTLRLQIEPGGWLNGHEAQATADNDQCVQWHVEQLNPGTTYRYSVMLDGEMVADGEALRFRTAPPIGQRSRVKLGFGSCALEDEGTRAVWRRVAAEDVDGFVLLGDTPYIDKTDLPTQRRRYREFAVVPEFQQLLQGRPFWGTWDDHDFGRNDSDGLLPGKENARRAFCEYRPQTSHGVRGQGVFQRFTRGAAEVFLLDTRWFARTERSFADPQKPTLLGKVQWEWLKQGLLASTAPFKVLACGMIWDDKQNKESDDWGTYFYELEAIKRLIAEHRITGVVLIGGDIHVTRVLKHDTSATVGYPLYEFISSPMHHKVIPSLNVPHPALIHSAVEPHTFLTVTFDDTEKVPALHAEFIRRDGRRLFEVTVNLNELTGRGWMLK